MPLYGPVGVRGVREYPGRQSRESGRLVLGAALSRHKFFFSTDESGRWEEGLGNALGAGKQLSSPDP